jgi:hypothetical protein
MSETISHKRAKARAAGKSGQTEVPIKGNRRVDAMTPKKATEIERSGSSSGLEKAARRLRDSGKQQKVLQVPQKHMGKATDAMKKVNVSGTVKNIKGSKRRHIPKHK